MEARGKRDHKGKTYFSMLEAADRLSCTKAWIRTLITEGKFKDVLRGERRTLWINKDEVDERAESTPRADSMKPFRKEEKDVDHRVHTAGAGLGNRGDV